MPLPAKLHNDRAAIDRARRGVVAYPLSHVLARPNERGDLHLHAHHRPQPWRDALLILLGAALVYLAVIGAGAVLGAGS